MGVFSHLTVTFFSWKSTMPQLNGHTYNTWESHNKMMLEPLSTNDPEVSV